MKKRVVAFCPAKKKGWLVHPAKLFLAQEKKHMANLHVTQMYMLTYWCKVAEPDHLHPKAMAFSLHVIIVVCPFCTMCDGT